jgi:hypothetical protein
MTRAVPDRHGRTRACLLYFLVSDDDGYLGAGVLVAHGPGSLLLLQRWSNAHCVVPRRCRPLEIDRKPRQLNECNCSICRRYGARWAYYRRKSVRVLGCSPKALLAGGVSGADAEAAPSRDP